MATSPNYAWAEPDNSSLVKNGAQDIRALGDAIDTSVWNIGFGQAGKNKIINGDFGIWQRGTSFSNPAAGAYTADRWYINYGGTGATRTISQQTFTPGTAPVAGYEASYFFRWAQTVAGSGSTYDVISQHIEDVRIFAGNTITLSFWAKSDATRTIAPSIVQNFGSGGSGSVTTSGSTVTTSTSWQRFTQTFAIPSITGKTIGTSSSLRLDIYIANNTVQTVDIWGVQLEYGSKATPFETATGTIQGELAACQRYYWRTPSTSVYSTYNAFGLFATTTAWQSIFMHPVQMRTAATSLDFSALLNAFDGVNQFALSSLAITSNQSTPNGTYVTGTVSGATAYRPAFIINNNSASSYVGFSAEL